MSVHDRLKKLEMAASKRLDSQDYSTPAIIQRFQKFGLNVDLWPWVIRQYAITYKIPVYGRVLTEKDAEWPTDALRQYYRTRHRLPWDREETDHAATFGPWEMFCERYDSAKHADNQSSQTAKPGGKQCSAKTRTRTPPRSPHAKK